MTFSQKQKNRLIEIIRQHAVNFGGGISSQDAAVREECNQFIEALSGKDSKVSEARTSAPDRVPEKKAPVAAVKEPPAAAPAAKVQAKKPPKPQVKKTRPAAVKEPAKKTTKTIEKKPESVIKQKISAVPKMKVLSRLSSLDSKPGTRTRPGQVRQIQAVHLFEAYSKAKLPKYGGYILSSFFDNTSAYTIFEIAGYDNIQDIYLQSGSLVFKSTGCKLFALIEPPGFPLKNLEPYQRKEGRKIPYRFSELNSIKTKKHEIIYVGKKPIISYSSFTVVKPRRRNFSVLFYNVSTVFQNMQDFIIAVINEETRIPRTEAAKAAEMIVKGAQNFNTWLDL